MGVTVILIFVASLVLAYLICSSGIAMTKKALADSAARRAEAAAQEPGAFTELDAEIGWTALDDVQLKRLLKDSAP